MNFRFCCMMWIAYGLIVTPSAFSADAQPVATETSAAETSPTVAAPVTTTAPTNATIVRGGSQGGPTVTAATATKPASARDSFQQRMQQLQKERLQAERDAANRPTAWQLQNPSGIQNRTGESQFHVNGYQAPNTYYGAPQRPWSNLSAPISEPQQPSNITPVPPLTQTRVMVAPYTYWGRQNNRWNMVSPAEATPYRLGGWNLGLGW